MNAQKHILIVEDVPFIYLEVANVVQNAGFAVETFTPSVNDAIAKIHKKRPDLVLLDIQLKGEENGIYLGSKLRNEYCIPYIYVTDHDDDYTFLESSQTQPEAFISKKTLQLHKDDIVVKTKPSFDERHLLRQITLTLLRNNKQSFASEKEGIMAFVDLPKNLIETDSKEISQRPVKFTDIEFFTSKIVDSDSNTLTKERAEKLKKEGRNIAKLITVSKDPYYYRGNLTKILEKLPYNFVRINSSEILNLTVSTFDGRINGRRLVVANNVYIISDTYIEEVEKRIAHFF